MAENLRERIAWLRDRWYQRPGLSEQADALDTALDESREARDEELERLRAEVVSWERTVEFHRNERDAAWVELSEAKDDVEIGDEKISELNGITVKLEKRAARWERKANAAEAERDLLRETLAESDLGAQVLAQWEAIAAADADRDRLEDERDALTAKLSEYENAEAWGTSCLACAKVLDSSIADHERAEKAEAAVERVRRLCELTIAASCRVQAIDQARDTLAALAAPESHEDGELCGDERPRLDGDERAIVCTLPKGHAAHRATKYGTAWEYLRDEDPKDTPTGGED